MSSTPPADISPLSKSTQGSSPFAGVTHVFWDLDGTLTDSAPGILNSCEYALQHMGVSASRESLYTFIGPPLLESFTRILGSPDKGREAVELYREYFSRQGLFENSVYEGAGQALGTLCEHGFSNVLTTAKPLVFARRILDHFVLTKYFALLGGADLHGPLHSKKDVLADNLRRTKAEPSSVLMVGDRLDDIEAAKSLGVRSCGVLYGYGRPHELDGADVLCQTITDVAGLLTESRASRRQHSQGV